MLDGETKRDVNKTSASASKRSDRFAAMREMYAKARKYPRLTKEEELELILACQKDGNAAALDKLVKSFTHLVIGAVVKPWMLSNYEIAFEDMMIEGQMALVQSIRKFDPAKDLRLASYAKVNIEFRGMEFVRKMRSNLSLGSGTKDRKIYYRVLRARKLLSAAGVSHPDMGQIEQIARECDISARSVANMFNAVSNRSVSFDATDGDERAQGNLGSAPQTYLRAEDATPEETVVQDDLKEKRMSLVRECLHVLDERERDVIVERFFGEKAVPLSQLGERLDMTAEGVRLIQIKAFDKIRAAAREMAGDAAQEFGL